MFGAWLVLTLLRTLTKDYDQMRSLSRWQAVGCAAFLNFTFYALFVPQTLTTWDSFTKLMVGINGFILFAMGLAMLISSEKLRVWWRTRDATRWALFAEDGPQWPWLVLSAAVGYGLLVWGLFVWKNELGFESETLKAGLVEFAVVVIFVTRDIAFIQVVPADANAGAGSEGSPVCRALLRRRHSPEHRLWYLFQHSRAVLLFSAHTSGSV